LDHGTSLEEGTIGNKSKFKAVLNTASVHQRHHFHLVDCLLHFSPNFGRSHLDCWRSHIWQYYCGCLLFQHTDCLTCLVCWCCVLLDDNKTQSEIWHVTHYSSTICASDFHSKINEYQLLSSQLPCHHQWQRKLIQFEHSSCTRSCGNTCTMWWDIWLRICSQYTAESNSEGILKVGQQLWKLWTEVEWHVVLTVCNFMSLYYCAQTVHLHLLNSARCLSIAK